MHTILTAAGTNRQPCETFHFPFSIFHSPHAVPLQRSIDAPAIPLRQLPHLLCKQHGERQEDHPRKTEQAITRVERQERQQRRQADLPPEQARLKGRAGKGRGGIGDGQAEGCLLYTSPSPRD